MNLQNIPESLKARPQWVVWKAKLKDDGKVDKIPVDPKNERNASHSDSKTWSNFRQAASKYQGSNGTFGGLGYVFSEKDDFVGVDLDGCRNPEDESIQDWAWDLMQLFNSYAEISPSGKGLHIICKGKLPEGGRKNKQVECYDRLRFFTMSGNTLNGSPKEPQEAQAAIDRLLNKYFNKDKPQNPISQPAAVPLNIDDGELLNKARAARNGTQFDLLYSGKWEEAGYPSQSEADLALINLLAFWCQNEPDRIARLFRESGLYRPKWDKKHHSDGSTYGEKTIQRAVASTTEVYQPRGEEQEVEQPQENKGKEKAVSSISVNDLLNHKFENKTPIIDKGILPQQGGLIFAGESGVGKSLVTAEWSVRLAMGWKILDVGVPTARTIKIFQAENPLNQVQFRLRRIIQGFQITNLPNRIHFSNPKTRYDLSQIKSVEKMIREIKACGADVFVIDPLISFHRVNENDNVLIRSRVLDNVTFISRETGAASIVVDHFNKPTQDNKNVAYRLRGGIAKKDWCDTLICMSTRRHEAKILRQIDFVKIRNGPHKPSLLVERDNSFINQIVEEDMLVPVSKVKEILKVELGGKADRQRDLVEAIVSECGCTDRTAKPAIRRAVEMGYIKELPGEGRAKSYCSMGK